MGVEQTMEVLEMIHPMRMVVQTRAQPMLVVKRAVMQMVPRMVDGALMAAPM